MIRQCLLTVNLYFRLLKTPSLPPPQRKNLHLNVKTELHEVQEMAQWLAIQKDQSLIPSTHSGQLKPSGTPTPSNLVPSSLFLWALLKDE